MKSVIKLSTAISLFATGFASAMQQITVDLIKLEGKYKLILPVDSAPNALYLQMKKQFQAQSSPSFPTVGSLRNDCMHVKINGKVDDKASIYFFKGDLFDYIQKNNITGTSSIKVGITACKEDNSIGKAVEKYMECSSEQILMILKAYKEVKEENLKKEIESLKKETKTSVQEQPKADVTVANDVSEKKDEPKKTGREKRREGMKKRDDNKKPTLSLYNQIQSFFTPKKFLYAGLAGITCLAAYTLWRFAKA